MMQKKEDKKGIFNDENSGLIKFKFCSHTTNRLLYLFNAFMQFWYTV